MRSTARVLVIMAALMTGLAAPALAVTAQDLVKLHVAGLSDDILIALIESDGSTFKLTADDILSLRQQGLSERVIHAMLLAGRKPVQMATREPAEGMQTAPVTSETAPPPATSPPPVIQVTQHVEQHVEQPRTEPQTVYVPIYTVVPVAFRPNVPQKPVAPVYWGYGGQRRPDAWRDRDR